MDVKRLAKVHSVDSRFVGKVQEMAMQWRPPKTAARMLVLSSLCHIELCCSVMGSSIEARVSFEDGAVGCGELFVE